MRFLGVDLGQRRIGLAWSDASGLLARPWRVVPAGATPRASADVVAAAAARYLEDAGEAPVAHVVVGFPRRLNGDRTHQTAAVGMFAEALRARGFAVHLQDERLTSREAESRLAVRERDWRARRRLVDAMAAAIILQDFLDSRPGGASTEVRAP